MSDGDRLRREGPGFPAAGEVGQQRLRREGPGFPAAGEVGQQRLRREGPGFPAAGEVGQQRLLEHLEPARPPADLAERAFAAAMAGESIIEAPTFWERWVPVAIPGAVAAALVALLLFVVNNADGNGPIEVPPVDQASVADVLGEGDVERAVINTLLVSWEP